MKISVVGMGKVGSAVAFALVIKGLCDQLVLVARTKAKALGDAYDLEHAGTFVRPMTILAGATADTAGSDIIILAASAPWPDNHTRLSLADDNRRLFQKLVPPLARLSPGAIFIIVANPVDLITYVTLKASGFPPSRVIGSGTLIDTVRFRSLLAQQTGINVYDLRAYILGEHGDSQFPALSVASAGGMRFDEHDRTVRKMFQQSRSSGFQVVRHKGYTNYAIAMATAVIVETIADDLHSVLPVSTLIEGYMGVADCCLSVPCVVGREGVLKTLPIELSDEEEHAFRTSAGVMKTIIERWNSTGKKKSAKKSKM